MRSLLVSSASVTAAVLALPLAGPALASPAGTPAAHTVTHYPDPPTDRRTDPHAVRPPAAAPGAPRSEGAVPGSTQSLALTPLPDDRSTGVSPGEGVERREVRPFSLAGVVWDDPSRELNARVELRTRDAATGKWGAWRQLNTHDAEHAADRDSAESRSPALRGSTAPVWVGASDAVELKVTREATDAPLPKGLHLELVDPGEAPAGQTPRTADPDTGPGTDPGADGAALPALDQAATEREARAQGAEGVTSGEAHIGPRPRIVTRAGWGADEDLREQEFSYTNTVKAAFVHHTAEGNDYTCEQAPSVIRGIYRFHVESSGWRDIGYNFLVDKCGNVYEGRAGGVDKPVMGAHTLGFNTDSTGIAVLGTYTETEPSAAALDAVAALTAWKLGLHGRDPQGKVTLVSDGGNLYEKGESVSMNVISGHRDGFSTECPGERLYRKLGTIRTKAAALQGR
ncbi:peptidoglycan recognition protein [Streptomyces sp. NPDC049954]|uniref:peptidoglycan recognition protein family protein n=1 Tax=Streptomyces sp. NPDC049954 TaxID=3155779 RepID=UPI0034177C60